MYFDNAATSFPKPESVCDAVTCWMREGAAAAGRGNHRGSDQAARVVDQCRSQLANLLGVPSPAQVIFTLNCTDSLNLVLQGFLRPGDRVLATTLDHNSVLRPLQAMKEQRDVHFELIDFDPATGLIDTDQFRSVLRQHRFRLVVLNHASNVTGRIQPVRELALWAREAGAAILLDAAQTAGHYPINMSELGVDFLAAAGHKGLLGPLGTGILCIRNGTEQDLQPLRFGGTGTASESLRQPMEMPARFESGNMNLPGIAGLEAAVRWIAGQSVSVLHQRLTERTAQLAQGLRRIPQVQVFTPDTTDVAGLVSFRIGALDCHEVAMILDQTFDIQCRAGLHCAPLAHKTLGTSDDGGLLRMSPGIFTSEDHIQTALDAIEQISREMI